MELKHLSIGRKAIKFSVVMNAGSENETAPQEERSIVAHEAPLPELSDSFAKLSAVMCSA